MKITIQWQPRDAWIGVYWTKETLISVGTRITLFVCILPMLPIVVQWVKDKPK